MHATTVPESRTTTPFPAVEPLPPIVGSELFGKDSVLLLLMITTALPGEGATSKLLAPDEDEVEA